MKKRVLCILVLVLLFSFNSKANASELCSTNGYTVLTVNGIFTDKDGAVANKDALKFKLRGNFNNQPLKVDFLYNPTHVGGLSDLTDVVAQGLFNEKSDYDLTNMLNDASSKVTTQKVLLVGSSQGNFYANNFYDKTASQPGGVPSQSIGVYGVGNPASRVAGGGKYVTSDTDKVINKLAGSFLKVLPPNIHINLQKGDDALGHDFVDVYLKYKSDRIISDIKSSLNNLQTNDEQEPGDPCVSLQKLTALHKIKGAVFAVADPVANTVKVVATGVYKVGAFIAKSISNVSLALGKAFSGLSANVINTLPDASGMTTILPDITTSVEDSPSQTSQPQPVVVEIVPAVENPTPAQIQTETAVPTETTVVTDTSLNSTPEIIPEVVAPEVTPIVVAPVVYSGGGGGGGGGGSPPPSDQTKPVIVITGDNPMSVNLGMTYTDAGATATDNVDATVSVITTGSADTAVIGTYTITYTATDTTGNIETATRTVNVIDPTVPDIIPPVITLVGENSVSVNIGTEYIDLGATATDDVDGDITSNITNLSTVDTTTIGTYTVTYDVSDSHSNSATQVIRMVNVINPGSDITPPVIVVTGDNPVSIEVGATYTDLGATATDLGTGAAIDVVTSGSVDTSTVGMYLITYSAVDSGGETGTSVRTVNVVSPPSDPNSSLKQITAFNFESLNPSVAGIIDETTHTIALTVPFGTDVTNLVPTITISDKASVDPNIGTAQNFSSPVLYTVTAEDNTTQEYTTTVTVAPDDSNIPDTTPPSVLSYDFNGTVSDVTQKPSHQNPMTFTINASENVNWVSMKIEKEDDPNLYKYLYSGNDCVDGTSTCMKIWFGTLTNGGLLQNGVYRLKVKLRDSSNNEFYDYLSPYVIHIIDSP